MYSVIFRLTKKTLKRVQPSSDTNVKCNAKNPRIKRTNELVGVKEIVLNLNELDNTGNLEDGRLSNTVLTYHVTGSEDFMRFEPATPQYKKLKNGKLNSVKNYGPKEKHHD